jgi:hypothetical protein
MGLHQKQRGISPRRRTKFVPSNPYGSPRNFDFRIIQWVIHPDELAPLWTSARHRWHSYVFLPDRRFSSHVGWNERGYPSIAGDETKHLWAPHPPRGFTALTRPATEHNFVNLNLFATDAWIERGRLLERWWRFRKMGSLTNHTGCF